MGEVAADIKGVLKDIDLPAGMRTDVTGDVEDLEETFMQMTF